MGITFFSRWLSLSGKPGLDSAAAALAAEPADAESQLRLGQRFAAGEGPDQDYPQAAKWFLKAAAQGNSVAQFTIGLMYAKGNGVLRSDATARMWLNRAARSGHAGAQYHVGVRQHRASKSAGQPDASECRIEAFKWLQLAVAQGYRGAESGREFVALGMTREEVVQGGRRAEAFEADRANSDAVAE